MCERTDMVYVKREQHQSQVSSDLAAYCLKSRKAAIYNSTGFVMHLFVFYF